MAGTGPKPLDRESVEEKKDLVLKIPTSRLRMGSQD